MRLTFFAVKSLVVIYFTLGSIKLSAFLIFKVAMDQFDTWRANIIDSGLAQPTLRLTAVAADWQQKLNSLSLLFSRDGLDFFALKASPFSVIVSHSALLRCLCKCILSIWYFQVVLLFRHAVLVGELLGKWFDSRAHLFTISTGAWREVKASDSDQEALGGQPETAGGVPDLCCQAQEVYWVGLQHHRHELIGSLICTFLTCTLIH